MATLPAGFYWEKFLYAPTEDKILNFQGYSVLALEGMTCKTFSKSTFYIDFDINYKIFLRDGLRIDEN